jgi:hypothetical protein
MSTPRRCPAHRQGQLQGAVTATKPTSPKPGRDVKGSLIKTAAALPHLIIAGLLWLVLTAALPPPIGEGVTVLGAFVLVLFTLRRSLEKEVVATPEVKPDRAAPSQLHDRDGSLSVRYEGTRRWQSPSKGRFISAVLLTDYGPIIPVLVGDGACNLAAMPDDEGSAS